MNDALYIAFKKDNKIPPRELTLTPKELNFQDRISFSNFEDKRNDDTTIPRITCYQSIPRAIDMLMGEVITPNKTGYFDIYQTVDKNPMLNPNFYSYDYLIKRGLIDEKQLLCRESWYVNEDISVKYVGTVKYNGNNYDWICKDYQLSDIRLNEGGVIENAFSRSELERGKIKLLFNCSENKERIIYPNRYNYGNRLKRKHRLSSYWFISPEAAMVDYIRNFLIINNILDKEDIVVLNDKTISKLYIREELKTTVQKVLNQIMFYINIINIPDYELFDKTELGYGWNLMAGSFSYDEPIEPDNIKQITHYDFDPYIAYKDEKNMNLAKNNRELHKANRTLTHGLIFKRGDKYRDD